ncbi:hypothetical protein [Desulfotomaculum defluvii]
MKELGLKATIYDIFGYLVPGIILLGLGFVSYEHSKGVFDVYPVFQDFIGKLDTKTLVFLLLIAYFLGHAISTISSLVIEKNIVFRFQKLSTRLEPANLLTEGLFSRFNNKFQQLYGTTFQTKDFRAILCYIEEYRPAVYSTVFVFMAFYGMARSIAFVLSSLFLWELINLRYFSNEKIWLYAIIYFISSLVFHYQYFRFLRYFREHAYNGFIVPDPVPSNPVS